MSVAYAQAGNGLQLLANLLTSHNRAREYVIFERYFCLRKCGGTLYETPGPLEVKDDGWVLSHPCFALSL